MDSASLVVRNKKYTRTGYEELNNLMDILGNYYNSKCLITTSGMQAIYYSLMIVCIKNKWCDMNLIYGNELYCDTPKLFEQFQQYFGNLNLYSINHNEILGELKIYENQKNILFIESCTNPNGTMFDFNQIKKLKEISKNLTIIVDNTWLTNFILNPFEFDVDIVVTSLTKYYSSGKTIAGAILFKDKDLYDKAKFYNITTGIHISPLICQILNREIVGTEERLRLSSENTINILNRLKTNKKIIKLNHPYMNNIDLKIYPSVFTIESQCTKTKLIHTVKNFSKNIKYETSFGSAYSKIDPWPKEKVIKVYPETGGCVIKQITNWRISIGYLDNPESIYSELEKIIDNL